MADPVGAPTFAQMFSPTKSPFHALGLAALVCLTVVVRAPLSDFATGFAVSVLMGAYFLAPFYQPSYTDRVYGLSLMYGRAAGLIGSLIAIAVLVTNSTVPGSAETQKLASDSPMFQLLRMGILVQAAGMALLFFMKTIDLHNQERRYNIIQFCLMQATLLVFIVLIAVGQNDFGRFGIGEVLRRGGSALTNSVAQIFHPVHISPASIVFGLILIWCVNGAVNTLLLIGSVEEGWVEDHGEGESN